MLGETRSVEGEAEPRTPGSGGVHDQYANFPAENSYRRRFPKAAHAFTYIDTPKAIWATSFSDR